MLQAKDLLNIKIISNIDKISIRDVRNKENRIRIGFDKGKHPNRNVNKRIYKRIPKTYLLYIKSEWWTKRKNQYFKRYGRRCEVCGSTEKIQLHHKLYGKYYHELDRDLVALCFFHHDQLHKGIGKVTRDMRKITDKLLLEMTEFQKNVRRNDTITYTNEIGKIT